MIYENNSEELCFIYSIKIHPVFLVIKSYCSSTVYFLNVYIDLTIIV